MRVDRTGPKRMLQRRDAHPQTAVLWQSNSPIQQQQRSAKPTKTRSAWHAAFAPHNTRSMSTWWPVKGIYIYIYRRPIYINTTCEYVISIRYVLSPMPQGPCNCGTLISDVDVSYCGVCLMLSYSAVRFSGLEFNRPLRRTTLTHVPAIIYSSLCLRCIIIIVIIFSVCALCVNHVQYFTNIEVLLFPISA